MASLYTFVEVGVYHKGFFVHCYLLIHPMEIGGGNEDFLTIFVSKGRKELCLSNHILVAMEIITRGLKFSLRYPLLF